MSLKQIALDLYMVSSLPMSFLLPYTRCPGYSIKTTDMVVGPLFIDGDEVICRQLQQLGRRITYHSYREAPFPNLNPIVRIGYRFYRNRLALK